MKSAYLFVFFLTLQLIHTISSLANSKPNIILIQADDLGWDDLAVHGNQYVETPALDNLAAQGIQFSRFYVNSVCAPTRASLLTGRHFLRTGVSHVHGGKDFVNLNETLLSEALKTNGYRTGMWGKWHSGKTNGYFPWQRGFDEAYMAQLYKHENSEGLLNGKTVQSQKWASEVITDYAIDFIQSKDNRPFFAYLSYLTVHAPLRAPGHLIKKYVDKGIGTNLATMYGMVHQMDSCVQVLLSELDRLEIADNTIVIFLSDNGPAYNDGLFSDEDRRIRNHSGFKGHKGNLWENGVKSPLLVRWPKMIKSGVDNRLVSVTDIYPTLVELAGGKTVEGQLPLDGVSFTGYFNDKSLPTEKNVYDYVHLGWANHKRPYTPQGIPGEYNPTAKDDELLSFSRQLVSVRKGPFKLMKNPFPVEGTNFSSYDYILVNIDNDPLEEKNLRDSNPRIFNELNTALDNWYSGILNEQHSFAAPEFQVNAANSVVLGYGASKISAGLTNTGFYLSGWQNNGQSAVYVIDVKDAGEYVVETRFSELARPMLLSATMGDRTVQNSIENQGTKVLGSLMLSPGRNILVLENKTDGSFTGNGESKLVQLDLKKITNK